MVEIAISLAVIGIALVGIIGVLPMGLHTQRDNREATVINQDATVFTEAISKGAVGDNDLTNYVYAITNEWKLYKTYNTVQKIGTNGYTFTAALAYGTSVPSMALTNGLRIVGLLSTPEFTDSSFNPTNNLFSGGYSNHVVAYVRSISGPAAEKPPQDNPILQEDSFSYRIFCVNAPVAMDTNILNLSLYPNGPPAYSQQLAANLHDLRLTFEWPQLPNGNLGGGRQTYRAMIGGQISQTNSTGQMLYFYQPQSFTSAP